MLTREEIATAGAGLLERGYGLYVASNRPVLDSLETSPFSLEVTELDFLGASDGHWEIADLMRVYNVLNATSFGEKGIPLQNWVMIDLGLLPSAFVLVTLPARQAGAVMADPALNEAGRTRARTVLAPVLAEAGRLGYDGPIPVAGYCAAPTPVAGSWVGWSLCSAIPGVGTTAKGLALEIYGARTLTGVAQFSEPGLRVHRKFGRMEILCAELRLHPVPHTLVYRTDVFSDDEPQQPTKLMDSRDYAFQREMQAKIDAGTSRFYVLPPGLAGGRVPILEEH